MVKRIAAVLAILALPTLLGVTISASVDDNARQGSFTVHEWGTFTSVAGPDGKTAQWLPLAGPTDLPCFVEQFQNPDATPGPRRHLITLALERG